jgi:D-glycero-D-manno-heptose 1,7-bisphosphate phosphatase
VKARPFVLLDRDGTVIVERHYLSDATNVELLPGVTEGLRRMREMGLGLAMISNQSGIARGLVSEVELEDIHKRMRNLLEEEKVILDGIYYCPHLPEDRCECRKPGTALLERAAKELGFNPRISYLIGDKDCDIEMGMRAGATTFLVLTGYGRLTRGANRTRADFVVEDLNEAATMIGRLLSGACKGRGSRWEVE